MKKTTVAFMVLTICFSSLLLLANTLSFRKAKVDFDAYEKLTAEVKHHRKDRLVNVEEFIKMSKEKKVIILDTRSDSMFRSKHIKGAVHLNFSDFTQSNLANTIPDKQTTILIYCNNNFEGDEIYFFTKSVQPKPAEKDKRSLTLALNIPTYINLYGYGYRNVYELSELVNVFDGRMEYEGLAVRK
jgi:Rhodanese-like domain